MYQIDPFTCWRNKRLITFKGFQTEKLSLAREAANNIFEDLGIVVAITKVNPDPFDVAMKALPACVASGLDRPKTVSDLVYQALHELDMYEEGQDGAITARQAAAVRKFVQRFGQGVPR